MQRIGRYEVLDELGRGAMGVVYRARDSDIGRIVALKVVSTANASPQEVEKYKQRFHREAQAAGRLSHPGIVTIHDIAEDEAGRPYIVMEFVEGRPLNLLLGPTAQVPLDQLLDIGIQVAKALDFAHRNGVVHRDIKPPNILITTDGRAKIADFGIARLEGTELTQEGTSLGTPSYMSPEQFRGGAVDGRSDIFSLGAVLYWMCTGKKPFPGDTITITSFQVAYENPPPPTKAKSGLPKALDDVLTRCLAKNPAHRYATCADVAADLEAVKDGRPLPAHTGTEPERTEPFPLPSRKTDQPPTQASLAQQAVDSQAQTRVAPSSTPAAEAGAPLLASAPPRSGSSRRIAWAAVGVVALLLVMVVVSKWLAKSTPNSQSTAPEVTSPAPESPPAQPGGTAEKAPPEGTPAPGTPVAGTQGTVQPAPQKAAAERTPRGNPPAAAASAKTPPPPAPPAARPVVIAMLEVYCKHPFKQATLQVYADDKILLEEKLEGKRRGITLGTTTSGEFDKKDVSIAVGQHTFHVRVTPKEGSPVWDDTVTGVLAEGIRDKLEITFKNSDTDPGGRKLVLAVHHPD
ncbi:MAG TPA: protein kinase [Candidatus Acidoferrales bacterium]|nr:protein kinase [Candidatus Acidoferrales bacterium]